MKSKMLAVATAATVLAGGVLAFDEIQAHSTPPGVIEQRVNANLIRVRFGRRWEEFPLVPLSENACQSGDDNYQRYCE